MGTETSSLVNLCVDCPSPTTRRVAIAVGYGCLCHGLFLLAIGTMIHGMYFGMSRGYGSLPVPWGWFWDALLLVQFPLLHSLLLSRQGRGLLKFLAPGDLAQALSTTTFAAVASAQILLLFAGWCPSGISWWQAEGFVGWLLSGLYGLAWLLLLKSMVDAGLAVQTGYLGWWSVLRKVTPVYPKMPVAGLFRWCRQPIYLSFALTTWTVPNWTPDQLVLASSLTLYCLIGPRLKEARYRRLYGADFVDYCSRVPYFFPGCCSKGSADNADYY